MTQKASKCAICDALQVKAYAPFCSKRCADLDLSRWMKGVYAIPGERADHSFDEDEVEG